MARYAKGKKSQAISDRSGFRVPYRQLKTEWNNLRVEPEEFEPKHPQLTPPKNIVDAQALFQPRPDNDPENISIYIGYNWFVPKVENNMMANIYDKPATIGARAKGNIGVISIEFNREVAVTGVDANIALDANNEDERVASVDYSIGQNVNYTVTVQSVEGANKYFIDTVQQSTMLLKEGSTYVFNWSAATSHPFRFSTTSDGTHNSGSEYTTGVVKDDSAYTTTITVAKGAPDLYYYCSVHSGMGGAITTLATSVSATNNLGTISNIETEQVVTGVAGTGAVAEVGSNLGINIPETSVVGTGALGTISIELDNPTWGVGTWGGGAWGQSLTTVDVSVTGVEATGNIGTEVPQAEISESGVAGTGATGSESINISTTSWGDETWGEDNWGQ